MSSKKPTKPKNKRTLEKTVIEKEIIFETLDNFGTWKRNEGYEDPDFTGTKKLFTYLGSLPFKENPDKEDVHIYQIKGGGKVRLTPKVMINNIEGVLKHNAPFTYSVILKVSLPNEEEIPEKLSETIKKFGFYEFTEENYLGRKQFFDNLNF